MLAVTLIGAFGMGKHDFGIIRMILRSITGLALIILMALQGGCASTISMTDSRLGPAQMFALSEEDADRVLATAFAAEFAGTPISRVEFPNKGYQATIRFALDSHTIVGYLISANGRTPAGDIVSGYYFEVSNAGTMPLSGSTRAEGVYSRVLREAGRLSPSLPIVNRPPQA